MRHWLVVLLALAAAAPAAAAPVRYVSQRGDKAYMREGPGFAYRVLWVYRHRGTPFRVTASYDVWRRVTGPDGSTGWMSANMLSGTRTVEVTGKGRAPLYARPREGKVVGLAEPGAVADLKGCDRRACRIAASGVDGWIDRARIWGVGKDEVF